MLFDVMIDRLHGVALTVGSSLHFTQAAVKLVVQYRIHCGLRPGNETGIFAVSIPAMGLPGLDPGNGTGIMHHNRITIKAQSWC